MAARLLRLLPRRALAWAAIALLHSTARAPESVGDNSQPIFDPGYNRDRGPVQVFTDRVHVAF
jgi:hypothetical protein